MSARPEARLFQNEIGQIDYVVMSGKRPALWLRSHYDEAYQFWHKSWQKTFKEVKDTSRLYSDDFCRQDEVTGLFHQHKAFGLFFFDWVDISLFSHRSHSYFKFYPEVVMDQLVREGVSRAMTMGFLTVSPQWRKKRSGVHVSEILVGLAIKRFLDSKDEVLLTYTRNDRRTNDLGYRFGAWPLSKNGVAHDIPADFLAFYRDQVRYPSQEVEYYVNYLWEKRLSESQSKRRSQFVTNQNEVSAGALKAIGGSI